jgi:alkylhydroperoxidase family enzyme
MVRPDGTQEDLVIQWLIRRKIAAFERKFDYDMSYARSILDDAGVDALMRFSKTQALGTYRADVPATPWYAAKIAAAVVADCGPCVQLVVTMALRSGVSPTVVSAVLRSDDAGLPDDVGVAVAFARASLHRAPDLDARRAAAVAAFGRRGLVALAFAITAATIYPTLKVALGHANACTLVTVDGAPIPVAHPA